MSSAYGFFNAQLVDGDYDRVYGADELSEFFDRFIGSGICEETNALLVSPNGSMNVAVSAGFCWIRGHYLKITGSETLTLDIGPTSGSRIDTIVARLSNSDRNITVSVVKGTVSADPVATAPVRTDDVYELVLAHIAVSANMTTVTQSAITDKRSDTYLCGFISPFSARTIPDGSVSQNKLDPSLVLPIGQGGTGGSTPAQARQYLEITPTAIGAKPNTQIESVAKGGTGANNAAEARINLGITPENISAKASNSIEDIAHGGTGASDAATARANLGVMATSGGTISGDVTFGGRMILTASDYGTSLPSAGTVGRLFFKKV